MTKRIGYKDSRGNQRYAQVTDEQHAGICKELREGRKISAIKMLREFGRIGLKESKEAIEGMAVKMGINPFNMTAPGVTVHRGNAEARFVGLVNSQARGRNGSFRASKLEVTPQNNSALNVKVWSVRKGKHAPVELDLSGEDAVALRQALDQLVPARW